MAKKQLSMSSHPGVGLHTIAGEPFYVEEEASTVYLRHEKWSLLGSGETLLEAEQDWLSEARELAPILFDMPVKSLDWETYRLKEFLYKVI